MKIAKEDLLWIRNYIAEKHKKELTPQQIMDILKRVAPIEISPQPGLVTLIKQLKSVENK